MSQVPAHSESDEFWFDSDQNSVSVTYYESQLLDRCFGDGSFAGPGNFVLSDVKAYKSNSNLQHELIVLSLAKVPRRHEQVSVQVHKLA
ncbi:hypothetical protein AGABI2DRAFT_190217, partial [Agaricus bisporus var. bisporus H97]|uniref:hypothetical protein n=1 Tax=Agaricus bisporus var. bisporus (strain H97 / ATCC MYA-4626 / FGSC 10389) TaxID=936046 RepID=UPI00029F5DC8